MEENRQTCIQTHFKRIDGKFVSIRKLHAMIGQKSGVSSSQASTQYYRSKEEDALLQLKGSKTFDFKVTFDSI